MGSIDVTAALAVVAGCVLAVAEIGLACLGIRLALNAALWVRAAME